MITKYVKLWIGSPQGAPPVIRLSQYDTDWKLVFTLYDGDALYTVPSEASVILNGLRPGGTVFSVAGVVEDGNAVVSLDSSVTAEAGKVECEISISNSGELLGTSNFVFEVEKAPMSGHTASGDDFSAVNQLVNQALSAASSAGTAAEAVAAIKGAVSSPLTATTAAGMTNTDKVYVYTGSETGYTSGHWYYYDGSAWQDGGAYNAVAVNTDTTLSVSGQAADAKIAGDVARGVAEDVTPTGWVNQYILATNGTIGDSATHLLVSSKDYSSANGDRVLKCNTGYHFYVCAYNSAGDYIGSLHESGGVRSFSKTSGSIYVDYFCPADFPTYRFKIVLRKTDSSAIDKAEGVNFTVSRVRKTPAGENLERWNTYNYMRDICEFRSKTQAGATYTWADECTTLNVTSSAATTGTSFVNVLSSAASENLHSVFVPGESVYFRMESNSEDVVWHIWFRHYEGSEYTTVGNYEITESQWLEVPSTANGLFMRFEAPRGVTLNAAIKGIGIFKRKPLQDVMTQKADRKTLNILFVGSSVSQGHCAYVPPILEQILPEYDITFATAHTDSAVSATHISQYESGTAYKAFNIWKPHSGHWERHGATHAFTDEWKLVDILKYTKWDIIGTYGQVPYRDTVSETVEQQKARLVSEARTLLRIFQKEALHPFAAVWYQWSGTSFTGSPAPTPEESYEYTRDWSNYLLAHVGYSAIFPGRVGIDDARTNTTLDSIGESEHMKSFDNNHLNAGLPTLIVGYEIILSILKLCGESRRGVFSASWLPTPSNCQAIGTSYATGSANVKMTHGYPVGIIVGDDESDINWVNIRAAQEIANLGVNHPDVITDCSDILVTTPEAGE